MVLSPAQSCPSSLSHHHVLAWRSSSPLPPRPCSKKLGQRSLQKWPGSLWTGTVGLPAPTIYLIVILWPLKSPPRPLLLHTLVKPLGFLLGTPSAQSSSTQLQLLRAHSNDGALGQDSGTSNSYNDSVGLFSHLSKLVR